MRQGNLLKTISLGAIVFFVLFLVAVEVEARRGGGGGGGRGGRRRGGTQCFQRWRWWWNERRRRRIFTFRACRQRWIFLQPDILEIRQQCGCPRWFVDVAASRQQPEDAVARWADSAGGRSGPVRTVRPANKSDPAAGGHTAVTHGYPLRQVCQQK